MGVLVEVETAKPLEHFEIAFFLGGDGELALTDGDAVPGGTAAQERAELGFELLERQAEVIADFLWGCADGGEAIDLGLGDGGRGGHRRWTGLIFHEVL